MAVWDWAVATGEFATLSTTRALKKLEVADLKIDDHTPKPSELRLETTGRDKAGGFDPYNQRGTAKRQGEAAPRAGITGSADAIDALASALGVAYGRVELPDGRGYTMDHSAALFLLDPQARFVAVFTPPHDARAIAADLRAIARRRPS